MTRRDIIIIAVLANIAVLAVLFMLAFRVEEEKVEEPTTEMAFTAVEEPFEAETIMAEPMDEVDSFIEEVTPINNSLALNMEEDTFHEEEPKPISTPIAAPAENNIVEITVKSGDVLEKIARANGTTVESIIKINNLKNDRLKIGQVLRVPVRQTQLSTKKIEEPKPIVQESIQYYTIKNGDNPWKIAKQFRLKVDDLLLMNNLDEETARKLKAGDQIRIK